MKIFMGCHNTANLINVLAEGLKALGNEVDRYSYAVQHAFYSLDGYLFLNFQKYQTILKELIIIKDFDQCSFDDFETISMGLENMIKDYLHYDLYIFVNGMSLLPYNLDYPILKKHDKTIISIFSGSEIRYPLYAHHMWATWDFHFPIEKFDTAYGGYGNVYTNSLNRKRLNALLAEFYADLILSVPEQSGVQTSPYLPYIHAIDTKNVKFKNNHRNKPKIVHIPSDKNFKQTAFIEKIVEELKNENLNFEFNIYSKIPHSQVLDILTDADILIDEMSLFPAVLSHEAMACGCAVLAGNAPMGLPIPLKNYHCPVLNINATNIKSQIKQVIIDSSLRSDLIEKGKIYIDQYAQPIQAAKRLFESLARYNQKDFDYYPSYAFEWMKYEIQDIEFPLLNDLQTLVLLKNGYFSEALLAKMCSHHLLSTQAQFMILSAHPNGHELSTMKVADFVYINRKYQNSFALDKV